MAMEHYVGFIGLGAMGFPMAMNVRKKMPTGATMFVYDVDINACQKFERLASALGPTVISASAREVALHTNTIISIVPAGKHVRGVYLDPENGVVAVPSQAQRLCLECSTIDIATAQDVGTELKKRGAGRYIDCPVSGGVPAADSGTLSMLVGAKDPKTIVEDGNPEFTSRLSSLLTWMGDSNKIFYCGDLGSGLAAKICNNYLSCTILLANAEAMATGVKLGLDPKLLHKVIANSTGQNFMCDNVCPVPGVVPHAPSSNGYKLGFKAQMLSKDVGLGVDAAHSVGVKPSIGEAAITVFDQVGQDERCIDRDASVVYRFLGGPE